jgi:hypothetical protein
MNKSLDLFSDLVFITCSFHLLAQLFDFVSSADKKLPNRQFYSPSSYMVSPTDHPSVRRTKWMKRQTVYTKRANPEQNLGHSLRSQKSEMGIEYFSVAQIS